MTDASPDVRRLRAAALKWYDRNGRSLPWRNSSDAYRVWLSEIMLQQTTVAAVIPYFERFTAAFPDVWSLAAADVERVLRLWEGLGYYSRARNLHAAAKIIVDRFGGQLPNDLDDLQSLPGVGRYTAGAIRSFAFDLPAPIVEANTERLYARLLALDDDVRSTAGRQKLWAFAESLCAKRRSGDLNQSLMDLGAKVCRPVDPDCARCPLITHCRALETNRQSNIPVRARPPQVTTLYEVAVVLRHRNRILLRSRGADERWAGLWDVPRVEVSRPDMESLLQLLQCGSLLSPRSGRQLSHDRSATKRSTSVTRGLFVAETVSVPASVRGPLRESSGCEPGTVRRALKLTYSVTRFRVELICVVCDVEQAVRSTRDRKWFAHADLEQQPVPQTTRRILNWVTDDSAQSD